MSNKMECVGCGAYSSSVVADVEDGEPCRFCGLPWEAGYAIRVVRAKKADEAVTKAYEEAITRATRAEAAAASARRLVEHLRAALDDFDRRSGTPEKPRKDER